MSRHNHYHPYAYDGMGEHGRRDAFDGLNEDQALERDNTSQRERSGWTKVRIAWWSRDLFVGYFYGWVWYEYNGQRCEILFHQDLHVHLTHDGRIEPPNHLMNHHMGMLRAMEAPF